MSEKINELKMNELKDLFFYTFGIVPLQNYGVIGDGMTDNRLKLQQAIYDAITVGAKYIFVPKGNYYYSQELFRADEVAFIGNSVDAYIKDVEIKQFPGFDNQSTEEDVYSTEETKTNGVWIDSKAIYRKVLPLGSVEKSSTTTVLVNADVETVINTKAIIKTTDGTCRIIPSVAPESNKYNVCMFYQIESKTVYVQTPTQVAIESGYITVEYTKTTD